MKAPGRTVERSPVDGRCPGCGEERLARYPILGEVGWEMVVKCQACLVSVERRPWKRLGPIELLIDRIPEGR